MFGCGESLRPREADVQSPARVLLIEYFVGAESTVLFLLRGDRDVPIVVPVEIGAAGIRAAMGSLDDAWQRAFGPLVAPVTQWCDEGDLVWLVPHDLLHYVPLHAVVVEGRYLIERNPVCYTPSASVMGYCRRKRTGRRARALVVGDPRGDLPHARAEAHQVARLFDAEEYYGPQATKSAVLRRLRHDAGELDILHFLMSRVFRYRSPIAVGHRAGAGRIAGRWRE
jgi:hypothetical protein